MVLTSDLGAQVIGLPPDLGCVLRPCNSEVAGWVQRGWERVRLRQIGFIFRLGHQLDSGE